MSTSSKGPSTRGELSIQPAYFTSSLFVEPLREDISSLISSYEKALNDGDLTKPYAIFKDLWMKLGWHWIHLKVLEPRGKEKFVSVVTRLFLERIAKTQTTIARVVGLFGMYTFFTTQPSTSAPPVQSIAHIALPLDVHRDLLALPEDLSSEDTLHFAPQVSYIVSRLVEADVFHILPSSDLHPENPHSLPREIYRPGSAPVAEENRKVGRPTKVDKARKSKTAITSLEKMLDQVPTFSESPITPSGSSSERDSSSAHPTILRPKNSLLTYQQSKVVLTSALAGAPSGQNSGAPIAGPLQRANRQVLTRLQEIDALAAERGLEVGGEGGHLTGLARVVKAVEEGEVSGSGLLGLLEGNGRPDDDNSDTL